MDRRQVVGAGMAAVAVGLVRPAAAWAGAPAARDGAPAAGLVAGVAAGRRLFAAGDYDGLQVLLPVLLDRAHRAGGQGTALAAGAWVLASQLASKQGRYGPAGVYAGRAGQAARASGDPLVLAAAARAAATPLRRTGGAGQALALLHEAYDELAGGRRAGAAHLDAAGMVALTAAYTAAQAHTPGRAVQFASLAEDMAGRLAAGRTGTVGEAREAGELSAAQCVLYRVGIHRELGDPDTALAYAARLEPARLPTPERRARAATDTARALLAAGDTAGAFGRLLQVERAAPLEARRPAVRAVAGAIAARRPGLAGLDAYLNRTGVVRAV